LLTVVSDPSRHTNGDAMRAHLLTFEVKRGRIVLIFPLRSRAFRKASNKSNPPPSKHISAKNIKFNIIL
jgi:hypothetical protein